MTDDADILVSALIKGEERYVVMYREKSRADALLAIGRRASDPRVSFTWYDAAKLSHRIRSREVA